jgi:hypothetical protein
MEGITGFILALLTAFSASGLNVFLSWLLLFRSAEFRRQANELEKKRKTIGDLKGKDDGSTDPATTKKIKRLEESCTALTKDLGAKNMRYTLVSGALLFVLNRLIRAQFDGIVVARIPFEPFSILQKVTHSGLETQDGRDGNFQFVYWLGTLLFRDALMRWFGFQIPQISLSDRMTSMAGKQM